MIARIQVTGFESGVRHAWGRQLFGICVCVLKFLASTSNFALWLKLIEDTGEYEEMEVPAPEYDEIKEIMSKLTLNKTSGSDNITPELIKVGGEKLWN